MECCRAFCPKLVRKLKRPKSLINSGRNPSTPNSKQAASPFCWICSSKSFRVLTTTSSIRAGWMRPSVINFSKDNRATSRLIGSKLERTTLSGVSSIITSTPVAISKARIFLPSRPITLPFISSLGKWTTLTVDSAAYSAAYLLIAKLIISVAILLA